MLECGLFVAASVSWRPRRYDVCWRRYAPTKRCCWPGSRNM